MSQKIINFLIRAKKATYAGNGNETASSRPNSHDLQYSEGSLKYIDSWLGGDKFAGEEALWENDVSFWAMNYVGRVIGDGFSGDFLKEALSHVPEENPYRGPSEYSSENFTYKCKVDGDFNWFTGYEEIFLSGNKIYELYFHGGAVGLIEEVGLIEV